MIQFVGGLSDWVGVWRKTRYLAFRHFLNAYRVSKMLGYPLFAADRNRVNTEFFVQVLSKEEKEGLRREREAWRIEVKKICKFGIRV